MNDYFVFQCNFFVAKYPWTLANNLVNLDPELQTVLHFAQLSVPLSSRYSFLDETL